MPKVSGVYRIRCAVTYKSYIGSSVDLEQRRYKQFYDLKQREAKNKPLQEDYDRYGATYFSFEVLEYCDKSIVKQTEQKWIDMFWESGQLYNRSPTSESPKGVKHTEETIKKFKGRPKRTLSEEHRKHISEAGKKRAPPSDETREKIRLSKLGNDFGKYKGKKNKEVA